MTDLDALTRATAALDAPLAALDLHAAKANLADLARRAGGTPIRVASKSVRCRHVLELALATPGFAGVMAYALREAIWLARNGIDDVLIGYPTADRGALRELAGDPALLRTITFMVDDVEQLELLPRGAQVCLDVDASLRIGPLHLGVRRSPLRTPDDAAAVARAAADRNINVAGVMFYEAQVAGMPDSSAAVRFVKRRSIAELDSRRAAVVSRVESVSGALRFVNSGGTGSLETSSADKMVTEVTSGSGIYTPTLFDHYRAFRPRPALYLALPVVRRPARGIATVFGGGYTASGQAGRSRMIRPVLGTQKLIRTEGGGEVQTPVRGVVDAHVGDRLWFRPAKAGEQLERFDTLHVVDGGTLVDSVPTYRGERQNFS